jgi:hypothetical protein
MGACGHVLSRQVVNVVAVGKAYPILKAPPPGWSDCIAGPIPGQGGRQAGQTGSEILPTHDYCNEGK